MYLNVILTILVITLIGVLTMLILWWKKYGKKVFDSVNSMKNILPSGNKNIPNLGNVNDVIGDLKKSMEMLNNLKNGGNKNGK